MTLHKIAQLKHEIYFTQFRRPNADGFLILRAGDDVELSQEELKAVLDLADFHKLSVFAPEKKAAPAKGKEA